MNNQHNRDQGFKNLRPNTVVSNTAKSRRVRVAMLAVTLLSAAVAACAPTGQPGAFDVGNMAYPEPLPQGNLTTVAVSAHQPPDVGNMAYQEPRRQGEIVTTAGSAPQPIDTGNMAYPAAKPTGIIATTTFH